MSDELLIFIDDTLSASHIPEYYKQRANVYNALSRNGISSLDILRTTPLSVIAMGKGIGKTKLKVIEYLQRKLVEQEDDKQRPT